MNEAHQEHTEARNEAFRLIEKDPNATRAWDFLIDFYDSRPHRQVELNLLLGFVMYYYWRILDRIAKEPLEQEPAETAAANAASLAVWVNKLILDLPSLFNAPRDTTRSEIVATLGLVQRMAENRATIALNAPDVFGFKHVQSPSPKVRHKAARRFAIGHLALGIKELMGGLNNNIVRDLAGALFPGDADDGTLEDKTLGEYRATATKSRIVIKNFGLPSGILSDV